jgi:pimeloyl-ACP methyl ester carboxylesterase
MRMMAFPGLHHLIAALPASEKQILSMLRQIGHGASLDAGRIPQSFLDWKLALFSHTPTLRSDLGETPTRFLWEEDAFGGRGGTAARPGDPHAELELFPEMGHLPWLDDPAEIGLVTAKVLFAAAPLGTLDAA